MINDWTKKLETLEAERKEAWNCAKYWQRETEKAEASHGLIISNPARLMEMISEAMVEDDHGELKTQAVQSFLRSLYRLCMFGTDEHGNDVTDRRCVVCNDSAELSAGFYSEKLEGKEWKTGMVGGFNYCQASEMFSINT